MSIEVTSIRDMLISSSKYLTFSQSQDLPSPEEIEMLRTKLSESEKISSQPSEEFLEDDLPDLESPQTFSRDSSSEVTVSGRAHILGNVQVLRLSSSPSTALFLQTREILSTWAVILGKLKKVGVLCIADVFELHPFMKDHFLDLIVRYNEVTKTNCKHKQQNANRAWETVTRRRLCMISSRTTPGS